MGTKHDILKKEEVVSANLRQICIKILGDYGSRLGKATKDVRILDLGCGRGTTVLELLDMGFNAYGIDIDSGPISN